MARSTTTVEGAGEGINASDGDVTLIPVNRVEQVAIPSGARAEFEFTPDASDMAVDVVAASKFQGLTYELRVDGTTRFGPVGIPPTDIDDMATTHNPRLLARSDLTMIVRNPSTVDRTVAVQIRGVEA